MRNTSVYLFALACLATLCGASSAQQVPPLAELESIGDSSPGTAGAPRLRPLGRPAVGEPGMGLLVEGGLPGAAALLVVGPGVELAPLPQYGATLVPQLPALRIALGALGADGRSQPFHSGPAPASAALMGLDFAAQAMIADSGAQGGVAFTNGLRLRFGAGYAAAGLFAALSYSLPTVPPYGPGQALATGDFDGNGLSDVVMIVKPGPGRIRLLRQLGDGTLAPPLETALPDGTAIDLAAAHLDADRHLDLAVIQESASGDAVFLLHGLGDGRLSAPALEIPLPAGGTARSVVVADVTGEGTPDLVVADWEATGLAILPSQSLPAVLLPMPGATVAGTLRAADLDGDGLLDLAVLDADTDALAVLRGLGGGAFAAPALAPTGLPDPSSLGLGDIDGDGDLDALVGHRVAPSLTPPPSLTLLVNDGSGVFASAATYGTIDFVDEIRVTDVELADLDGDADLDVLVCHRGASFPNVPAVLLENLGAGALGSFESLPLTPTAAELADFDGNGTADFAGMPSDVFLPPMVMWIAGLPDGLDLPPLLADFVAWPVRAGDLDGDGDLDLVGRVSFDTLAVSLWSDPQGFGPATSFPAGGNVTSFDGLDLADVDLDGALDAVVAGANTVRVLPGDGAGGLGAPVLHGLQSARVPRVADMNADGRPDLVVSRDTLGLSVLIAQAGGGFAPAVTTLVPLTGLQRFEVGDLDADGWPDVVAQDSHGVLLFHGLGDGSFTTSLLADDPSFMPQEAPLALADLDGDGDLDLLRQDFDHGLRVWLNDGLGTLVPGQRLFSFAWFRIAAVDLNLDGALDILGDGVALGFGDGRFSTTHPGFHAGAVGDFDGDGDVDEFLAGRVLFNRIR